MSFMGGGSGGGQTAPPFHPVQIGGKGGVIQAAIDQDLLNYRNAYTDWQSQFPGLAAARQNDIEDAYKQLTGPLDPVFQKQFMDNATMGAQGAFGGGNPLSALGLQTGSAARGAQSAGFTKQVLQKQDYDISRINNLEAQNPMLPVGLSPSQILQLRTYNTNAQNAATMAGATNQFAVANANYNQEQNLYGSLGSLISSFGSMYTQTNGFSGFGGFDGGSAATFAG